MAYLLKHLGITEYQLVYDAMRQFTDARDEHTCDEIWLTEHLPVFTQGLAGKAEHILEISDIPIVQSNRGGQVTYHGVGQLIVYPLMNLHRLQLNTRDFVTLLERSTIQSLKYWGIDAYAKQDAPGVYVDIEGVCHKIASLGLRVKKGFSYHGLSLNVNMDLTPFLQINPCGYQGLKMTSLQALGIAVSTAEAANVFLKFFDEALVIE